MHAPAQVGLLVHCYTCHGVGAVGSNVAFDGVSDREQWPQVPCVFEPDCPGQVVPEALN